MATTELRRAGLPRQEIEAALGEMRKQDRDKIIRDWDTHTFLYTFNGGNDVKAFAEDVYRKFLWSDALSSFSFPSVKALQDDLMGYAAGLLGGDEATAGRITTGGTESIILALKAARDWARERRPHVATPEIILTSTAHPAFLKASHLLGLIPIVVPIAPGFTADIPAMTAAICNNTIALVGSAPAYWHGVFDPIAQLSDLARERDLWLHVDGCLGGLLAPFVRKLGYQIPPFDLSLPGVKSISADFHKYGYSPKGVSALLFRGEDEARHTYFEWTGGIDVGGYRTPGLSGTRSGGAIAAAWAVMNLLGHDGYLSRADSIMRFVHKVRDGVSRIDGLQMHVEPQLSVLSIGAPDLSVDTIGAHMAERGWMLNVFGGPPAIHMRATPMHEPVAEQLLSDLADSVARTRRGEKPKAIRTGVYAD